MIVRRTDIGKHALSKLTRDTGIKVVLTGEGSDEQFAGYGDLLVDFLREPDLSWPHRELPEDTRTRVLQEMESPKINPNAPSLKAFLPKDSPSTRWARNQINNNSILGVTDFISLRQYTASWTENEFGWVDSKCGRAHRGKRPCANNSSPLARSRSIRAQRNQ